MFRARVVNPRWIAAMQRHGYKGAFELAATVDYLFGYDATAGVVDDWMYVTLAREYVFDEVNRAFLERSNPWALRGITERLLEAADRGMWAKPDDAVLDRLRSDLPRTRGRPGGGGMMPGAVRGRRRAGRPRSRHGPRGRPAGQGRRRLRAGHSTGETGRAEQTVLHYAEAWRVERVVFALHDREHTARREQAWDAAAAQVARWFAEHPGGSAVFATIGDPCVYSTFTYLAATVRAQGPRPRRARSSRGSRRCSTSPHAPAPRWSRGGRRSALFPMTAGADRFRETLERGDALVAYKFGRMLPETLAVLRATGRLRRRGVRRPARPS